MKSDDHGTPKHIFVSKNWGGEEWIVNKSEYCGKLLTFNKGKKCSIHYHLLKNETFYVYVGKVEMWWTDDLESAKTIKNDEDMKKIMKKVILDSGDSFSVPQKRVHRVVALQNSTVFEFSTFHEDADSYRILKGD